MAGRAPGGLSVIGLTAGLWFLGKFLRYAFPPLFEPLQAAYAIDNATIGLAFTGFMICYAAMQFPAGLLGDRLGTVRVVALGGVVAGTAATALIVEAGFPLLVVGMLVIGAGTGMHKTVAVTLLADAYQDRHGRMLGIHDTIGAGAGIVAPLAVVVALDQAGWRSLFLVAGIAALALGVATATYLPRRLPADVGRPDEDRSRPSMGQYVGLFRRPRFGLFAVVTVLFAFAYNGLVAFLPLYLTDVAGLTVGRAGVLYSLLFAMTVVQLVTGELSDRTGRLPVILGCLAVGLAGMTVLITSTSAVWLAVAVLAFGVGGHGYRPVRDAYLTSILPEAVAGGGLGIVRMLLMAAGASAPAIVGVIADTAGFRPAFAVLGLAVFGAVLAVGVLLLGDEDADAAEPSTTGTG